jgi:hypothetical protein
MLFQRKRFDESHQSVNPSLALEQQKGKNAAFSVSYQFKSTTGMLCGGSAFPSTSGSSIRRYPIG